MREPISPTVARTELSESDIRGLLDEIVDPCSANAGAPAGLNTMGLVHHVAVQAGEDGKFDIEVALGLTEPGCLMGWVFVREAEERLAALELAGKVNVRLDTQTMWTPERLDPEYSKKLAEVRRVRFENVKNKICGAPRNVQKERQP